jgi:hypothetical protein
VGGAGAQEPLVFHDESLSPGVARVHGQNAAVSIERTHSPDPFRAD